MKKKQKKLSDLILDMLQAKEDMQEGRRFHSWDNQITLEKAFEKAKRKLDKFFKDSCPEP